MTAQQFASWTFFLFVGLLILAFARMLLRAYRQKRSGNRLSLILVRDLTVFGLLGIDFALVLAVRASGLAPIIVGELWWILLTSGIAIIAAAVLAGFELFVIGYRDERDHGSGND